MGQRQSFRYTASHAFTRHAMAVAVSRALMLGVAVSAAMPVLAQAEAPAPARKSYAIPAGSLVKVLARFGQDSGAMISYRAEAIADRRSSGLSGSYSVGEALQAIVAGTGLRAAIQGNGGYVVEPVPQEAGSQVLSEVKVLASGLGDGSGAGYAPRTITLGKGQSLRDTPQSVSVVTRQRLEDQNLTTLESALEQTTGITLQQSSSVYTGIYSRGFEVTNLQIDGGASLYRGYGLSTLPDMSQYEQLEVLRGADGLFSGTGEPGGTVNLTRKRPTATPQASVALSAGRWNSYRAEADVSGPLAFAGKLRGRAVLAYEDKDSFQDVAHYDKTFLYGIVEAELSDSTLLTLGGSHEERSLPYVSFGLPRYSTGGNLHLPRSIYLAAAWSKYDTRVTELFARLDQKLGKDWTLTLDALDSHREDDRVGLGWATAIDPVTHAGGGAAPARYEYIANQRAIDLALQGKFNLLGRRHEVVVGGNRQRALNSSYGEKSSVLYAVNDIFAFDPHAYPEPNDYVPFFRYPSDGYGIRQSGLYGVLRLQVSDPLKVIVGARRSDFEYNYVYEPLNSDGSVASSSTTRYQDKGVVTPYGGVVYQLSPFWSAYASLGETYKSQADRLKGPIASGTPLNPVTGRNYEAGLKGELFDGQLNASAALYRVERNGEAVRDSNYPVGNGDLGSSCCWLDDGEVVSKGLDTEISGEVTSGWLVSAGYTFNDNENKQKGGSRYNSITPRHILKLFSTWQLPGTASAWRVGGGVTAKSASYVSGSARTLDAAGNPTTVTVPYEFTQGGHSIWTAFAEYRMDPRWTATVNVTNVFDKTYYSTIGQSGYYNFYGEPRNLMLTLRGTF